MTRFNEKDISDIAEVREFIKAQAEMDRFKSQHEKVFEEYDKLVEDYNQKLEAAEKAVRSQEVSCGPFEYYQKQIKWDVDGLFDDLGRDRFLKIGGTINTVTQKAIDKTKIESAAQQGLIPSDVVERRRKVSPRYHTPNKVEQ